MDKKETIYGAVRVSALNQTSILNRTITIDNSDSKWILVTNPNVFTKIKQDSDVIFSESMQEIYQKISKEGIEEDNLISNTIGIESFYNNMLDNNFKKSFKINRDSWNESQLILFCVNKTTKTFAPGTTPEEMLNYLKSPNRDKIYIPTKYYNEEYYNQIKNPLFEDSTFRIRNYHPDIEGLIKEYDTVEYNLKKWKSRRYAHLNAEEIATKRLRRIKPITNNELYKLYNNIIDEFKKTGNKRFDKLSESSDILYPFWDSYNASRSYLTLKSKKDIFTRILKLLYISKHFGNKRDKVLFSDKVTANLLKTKQQYIKLKSTKDYKHIDTKIVITYLLKYIYPRIENDTTRSNQNSKI